MVMSMSGKPRARVKDINLPDAPKPSRASGTHGVCRSKRAATCARIHERDGGNYEGKEIKRIKRDVE